MNLCHRSRSDLDIGTLVGMHSNEAIGLLIANEVFHGPLIMGKLLDAAWAGQFVNERGH
jgi:hypothetical protein